MPDPGSLNYPYDSHQTLKNMTSLKQKLSEVVVDQDQVRIAIFSEATTETIKDFLELFLLKKGIKSLFYQSNYGKMKQDLLQGSPEFKNFNAAISIVYTTSNDLNEFPSLAANDSDVHSIIENKINELKLLWQGIRNQSESVIIQNNFEYLHLRPLGNLEAAHPAGRTHFIRLLNEALVTSANKFSSLHLHDLNYLSSLVGLDAWNDRRLWHLYSYPSSINSLSFIAESLSSMISSIRGQSKKLLVLDGDNTLWGGTLDEMAPEEIKIGRTDPESQSYLEFQNYVKKLSDKGIILGLISKNDRTNLLSALKDSENALTESDFSSIKANWNNKDVNMSELLSELHLKSQSAVFVDDSPFERSLMSSGFADLVTPELHGEAMDFAVTLDRNYFFESVSLHHEDLDRKHMFTAEKSRAELQKITSSYDDFLRRLEMKLTIHEIDESRQPRVTQLINKTNQFNLTHNKVSQQELKKSVDGNRLGFCVSLSDKFGNMGLVGTVMVKQNGPQAEIENWVMSCRVIGRKVEDEMFKELISRCKKNEITEIKGLYKKTGKNLLVKDLYSKLGFSQVSTTDESDEWSIQVNSVIQLPTGIFSKVINE